MERNIYLRRYRGGLIAACDKEVLGKCYRSGDLKLEVKEDFYGGDLVTREEFLEALEKSTMANLVGKRVVEFAISKGYVDRENVLKIGEVLYAQVIVI